MKRRRYIYIIIFLVLLAAVFGFKKVSNNTETSLTQEDVTTDEIKVTFVELGSVGCIPCDKMQPIMKEIKEEYKGQVKVVFHDVKTAEGNPYIKEFGIRAIPTQVFLDKDGNEYFRHLGFFAKDELIKVLKMQGVN
ncbi:thioredoxin family protein [bacterium]|nr:thioredoxin family protein [Candidatus Atribacteria bacterium]MBU1428328.1 thioredoxin family protein [bacterium]MBU4047174.1 thioredoxin family protein [bacterium]MBU4227921.1 thioredoxin family protein [bacterium]MBU4562939.1 thioredoxin family protein [bacterium]